MQAKFLALVVLLVSLIWNSDLIHADTKSGSQYEQALSYFNSKNYRKAYELFLPLANAGNVKAQFKLGVLYTKGWGVEKDESAAIYWYEKAAKAGLPKAQYNLGKTLIDRVFDGVSEPDDGKRALYWFKAAASSGMKEAENAVGIIYWSGRGVRRDYEEAVAWFQKAAPKGSGMANFMLGIAHLFGLGTDENLEKSAEYFRRAVDLGNEEARYYLGLQYQQGLGVPKDEEKAMALIAQAAERGSVDAWFGMFEIYAYGLLGQEVDKKKAMMWLRKYCRGQTRRDYEDCVEYNLLKGPPEGLLRQRSKAAGSESQGENAAHSR